MTAILDVAQFSLVEVHRRFRGAYFLHCQVTSIIHLPDDEGSMYLGNVDNFLPDYTAQNIR
jgi:hypothetical protein